MFQKHVAQACCAACWACMLPTHVAQTGHTCFTHITPIHSAHHIMSMHVAHACMLRTHVSHDSHACILCTHVAPASQPCISCAPPAFWACLLCPHVTHACHPRMLCTHVVHACGEDVSSMHAVQACCPCSSRTDVNGACGIPMFCMSRTRVAHACHPCMSP